MVISDDRAKDIFLDALQVTSQSDRQALLDERCAGDERLRREVEELLAEHKQVGVFLQSARFSAETTCRASGPESEIGTKIGPYKLLQQIGEGGMGVVYMAEQCEPVHRRVALKLIKPGMDSSEVVARFEAERQALALMDHPNIARVFDAGAADDGRPYFAMELVKGILITRYCDEHRLSTRRRLELFLAVCRAVQHAHQKGIIHRDLKPSNVLVAEYDHEVVPKIIDFGISKALSQSLTQRTMFTRFGQIIGTLDYMSPEQAKLNQLDIDTRSDVYSLGVLLYELLTGTTPFDKQRLRDSSLDEVLRIIREEEPPKPSTRLSVSATLPALASMRATDARRLPGLVRGDLDWIVVNAMAKERSQRYQSSDALGADIQRYLHDQPIAARRPSTVGRIRRFVGRRKVPVALTALVVLASGMALAFGVVAYLGRLNQREQAIAIRETEARQERERWARYTAMPTIKQLVEDGRVVHAFRLAKNVQEVLPDDPAFRELWSSFTVTVTFDLQPPGTRVSIRDWDGVNDQWLEVGETPLVDVTLPNGNLRFRYEKEGYITKEFHREFPEFLAWDGPVSMTRDWGVPDDMVLVHQVPAAGWNSFPADLGAFLIDRYEVTNRQFQEFVAAGGYGNPAAWEQLEFTKDGKVLTWREAMEHFRDETGHPGPAVWRDGTFPEGQEDFPVRGVSWFEAAAYARFTGKSLPTIHHWKWAADGIPGHRIALSNFSGRGPDRRGANQGIGRFDTYDMAGNVKEWCWNEDLQGRRCLRGGAWNEAGYRLMDVDVASPWDRGGTHGFRCVRYLDDADPRPASLEPWQRIWPQLAGRVRKPLESLLPWYKYDQGRPLDAESVGTGDQFFEALQHEVVRINAAYDNERIDVHLFFPREKRKKYETVLFVPGAGAWLSQRLAKDDKDEWDVIDRLVQSGRIVCLPVLKGMFHRGNGKFIVHMPAIQARDTAVAAAKDVAQTVDYLRTRDDVDTHRIVYCGYSSGAVLGVSSLAVYPGFQAAILISGGYPPAELTPEREVFHPFHFTPRVKIPVLMINGRYDTVFAYQSAQVPFFDDLGTPDNAKQHVTLESGHNPPVDSLVKEVDNWLRVRFGPP